MRKNLEISVRVKNIPRHATTMALSASGTKRDETKKDTKRTCRPSLQKHQKIINKKLINNLPRDIILMISKMHPLLIPPFTNKTLRRAVKGYLAGGDRKKRIVAKYGEISNWDTSNVTNMRYMFHNATAFNQPLNKWNVSNVTNMRSMFSNATSFNQPLDHWNVSNVKTMWMMFCNARSFNQPLNTSGNKWNVSNVTNMRYMFGHARSFNHPLNDWNVSSVTNMCYMFWNARSFNQPLNDWNVSNVMNMRGLFNNSTTSFNQPLHAPWYQVDLFLGF